MVDAGTKQMSVSTFGTFIKLIKVQCTKTWVSPRDRRQPEGRAFARAAVLRGAASSSLPRRGSLGLLPARFEAADLERSEMAWPFPTDLERSEMAWPFPNEMAWPFPTPHSSSLAIKSKKKRSSRSLQMLKVKKLLLGLPNVLNKNNSIPHVLCVIRYPSRSRLSTWKNKRWHGEQCCQKALCNGCSEERPGEVVRQW